MGEWLMLLGAFVIFTGALGFFLLKEPFQRFHPTTLAGVFGLSIFFFGAEIETGSRTGEYSFHQFIGIFCLFLVMPLAGHILAKALYRSRATPRKPSRQRDR